MRAEFAVVREGDDLTTIEKLHRSKKLDEIQEFLHDEIGVVEMDFSDLLDIPEKLDSVKMGKHWLPDD